MTNEELKKKIKEILRKRMTELLGSCHTDEIPLTEEGAEAILFYADEFADALIKNGYGDVSEWKRRAEVAEKERDEYRRSNRIVLRGLEIIKRNIIRYCHTDLSNILLQAAREIEEEERK